ncbi:MAG: TIGR03960 family B12-binding radical SAM protein [Oscillospiraceae bacterium]
MDESLKRILPKVQKPARYTGGEYNEIIKDRGSVDTRVAFCFPDTYEIGMSNLGLRILYGAWNEINGVWCERVFAPWGDMEEEMRKAGIPLFALESGDYIRDFDIIAFSLGYEMAYTSVLNMLSLAGLPLFSKDRQGLTPLVIAGGTACFNPEPLSDFVDIFLIGEGEDVIGEVTELYRSAKRDRLSKESFLKKAAAIQGAYVPSMYNVSYNTDGTVNEIKPKSGAPATVTKRIVQNFDESYFPEKTIVPSTEIVHDRVVLELFRGCIRGCRFCQAGHVYRPVRSRKPDVLLKHGVEALKDSGYEEITLSSLSTSDYRELGGLCDGLLDWCEGRNVSLSLPSLRADNFSIELMERVQKVRRTGLTFAPEAGSQRLRDAINKNVLEEDLLNSCRIAFEGGWNSLKLYFMLGLPTETDEDVVAIAELAGKVLYTWKQHAANKSRGVKITVSTSCFIPKPDTPFQWEAQVTREEYERRVALLRSSMRARAITYHWHAPDTSLIEAVLSRGDRRLGSVLHEVWRTGGKLDSWDEYFSFDRWMAAFGTCSLDPSFYANRERGEDEVLPWSHISCGVSEQHFKDERRAAYEGVITPDCRKACTGCSASALYKGGRCDE